MSLGSIVGAVVTTHHRQVSAAMNSHNAITYMVVSWNCFCFNVTNRLGLHPRLLTQYYTKAGGLKLIHDVQKRMKIQVYYMLWESNV